MDAVKKLTKKMATFMAANLRPFVTDARFPSPDQRILTKIW